MKLASRMTTCSGSERSWNLASSSGETKNTCSMVLDVQKSVSATEENVLLPVSLLFPATGFPVRQTLPWRANTVDYVLPVWFCPEFNSLATVKYTAGLPLF